MISARYKLVPAYSGTASQRLTGVGLSGTLRSTSSNGVRSEQRREDKESDRYIVHDTCGAWTAPLEEAYGASLLAGR